MSTATRTTHDTVPSVQSVEQIRAQFPALLRQHNGESVAYFDGPGGTQVPQQVADAMSDYLLHHNANTHWEYPTSAETDAMLAAAREAAADFLNASATEVAFGNNMTTLTFHLARALGMAWGPGDEIVITDLDHHANQAPWRRLEKERGVTVKRVEVRLGSGQLDWASFERAIGPRTKLVAVGAGSNALGTINDVTRAAKLAHNVGALVFVDAVHYAPHALVDVRAMDCDFLACSAYKFYGPHAGVLFGKKRSSKSSTCRVSNRRRTTPQNASKRARRTTKAWSALAPPSIFSLRSPPVQHGANDWNPRSRRCMHAVSRWWSGSGQG